MQALPTSRPLVLRPMPSSAPSVDIEPLHFPLPTDSLWEARIQSWLPHPLSSLPTLSQRVQLHSSVFYRTGEAGTPRPYSLRHDDMILSTLLLSIFLMMWIVLSSWRFLRGTIKDFFRHRRRANFFTDRADTVLQGRWYTLLQTSFLQSILSFEYVRQFHPEVFDSCSPYTLLGGHLLLHLSYYLLTILLYRWVNSTFFSPTARQQWANQWFVSVLTLGIALSPFTLLLVFFALPPQPMVLSYILLIVLVKSLLFYKTKGIFFSSLLGNLHIILYFCTLEVAPLLGLGFALYWGTPWLSTLL